MKQFFAIGSVLAFVFCAAAHNLMAADNTAAATTTTTSVSASQGADSASEAEAPVVKTMKGGISKVDSIKKIVYFVPDNVGAPIEVVCEKGASACDTTKLISGKDAEVRMYEENGKWLAKSIKEI